MKSIRDLLLKLRRGGEYALSMSVGSMGCRWVYGEISRQGQLSFKSILASGGEDFDETPVVGDSLVASAPLQRAVAAAMNRLPAGAVRPRYLVLSVPSKHAYLGEINVLRDERESMIRYQIQELMEIAAGSSEREAAFDWQLKTELSDGHVSLAVAGIDQRQVDEIRSAADACGLQCLGITLDTVAAMNGYLQMVPAALRQVDVRFLLHGELSRNRVRLAVFSHGVLFNESWEHSEEGFSVVQAISALERLVSGWARDGVPDETASVRLILGGELMYAKGCELTAKRSQVLSPRLLEIPARRELQGRWHDDVVPFGALEAMPCE